MPYEVWPSDVCGDYVGQIARSINPAGRRGRVHCFTHCYGDTHSDDMTGAEMNSARSIWSSHGLILYRQNLNSAVTRRHCVMFS